MVVKQFVGTTIHEAMQRAKESMGEDIMLVDSKQVVVPGPNGKERRVMQITVTPEISPTVVRPHPRSDGVLKLKEPLPNLPAEAIVSEFELNRELQLLKKALVNLTRRVEVGRSLGAERVDRYYKQLSAVGLSDELILDIVNAMRPLLDRGVGIQTNTWWNMVERLLKRKLEWRTPDAWISGSADKPVAVALMGPTGGGKTTTAAKLALRFSRRRYSTAVITSHTGPSLGHLKSSEIKVLTYRKLDEWSTLKKKVKRYSLIILDTTGASPYDRNHLQSLINLTRQESTLHKFLVLPATADLQDLSIVAGIYKVFDLEGVIVTKLDETTRPGKAIQLVAELRLPWLYLCDGQELEHNMQAVTPAELTKRIRQATQTV